MLVYMHTHTHVCSHTCMHIHTCMFTCMCTNTYVCVFVCTNAQLSNALSYLYCKDPGCSQACAWSGTPLRSSKEAYSSGCSVGWLHGCLDEDSFPSCFRYEEEVALRATAENEFVALKKVSG